MLFRSVGADVVTKNLLDMLDALEKFQTVREGDLILRFSPEEAAVMKEYAVPFAKQAVESLTKQWGFTPKGPLIIEMFPKHDDFAVRTMGLPGMVGALGVCFGTVVALDSPKARPPGDFSWQETLLHELTHVMTIQLSNNRVPRWLTEGISVFEERRGSPEWGREMTVSFAQAMNADKVFHVSPFCSVSGQYTFRFDRTGDQLSVRVDLDDHGPLLQTGLSGQLLALTRASARRAFFGTPLMTLGVVARIHWQALQLWLRRVPFFSKPTAPAQQVSR